jgi:3-oxoacyl-[acyl-carrier-protein] synthase-3
MRWHDIHIRGIGAAQGDLIPVDQFPSADHVTATGQRAVSVAHNTTGMDLAVRAGCDALISLTMTSDDPLAVPDLHFHAAIWHGSRGIDLWSRAAYVRAHLGLPAGPGIATEINAMSNSLAGAIDLSARILAGSPDTNNVMLTGGETFGAPAFDHLTADHGIGGSALILGRQPGLAEVVATSSWSDPTLEQLHRDETQFLPPGTTEVGIEAVRQRKAHYRDDLSWVLLPHYGQQLLHTQCPGSLRIDEPRTVVHAGDQWGHIGPNDQLVGLTRLLAHGATTYGDHIAMIGIGIGMTWTAIILRITTVPAAMHTHAPPLLWPWRTPTPIS